MTNKKEESIIREQGPLHLLLSGTATSLDEMELGNFGEKRGTFQEHSY
jgi:hypothetical protein